MAAYSPPMMPNVDSDIREDLLQWLDEEIMTTQQRHDEVQKTIREWR